MNLIKLFIILMTVLLVVPFASAEIWYDAEEYNPSENGDTVLKAGETYQVPGDEDILACQEFEFEEGSAKTDTINIKSKLRVLKDSGKNNINNIEFRIYGSSLSGNNVLVNCPLIGSGMTLTDLRSALSTTYNEFECSVDDLDFEFVKNKICVYVEYDKKSGDENHVLGAMLAVKSDTSRSGKSNVYYWDSSWQQPFENAVLSNDLGLEISINEQYNLENIDSDGDGIINSADKCWEISNIERDCSELLTEDDCYHETDERFESECDWGDHDDDTTTSEVCYGLYQSDINGNCFDKKSKTYDDPELGTVTYWDYTNNLWRNNPECGDVCDGYNIYTFSECPAGFLNIFNISSSINGHISFDESPFTYEICARNSHDDLVLQQMTGDVAQEVSERCIADGITFDCIKTDEIYDEEYIVSVSDTTNAHAGLGVYDYAYNLSYNTGRKAPNCSWVKGEGVGEGLKSPFDLCSAYGKGDFLFSINDVTNSHVGDAQAYKDTGWVFCCHFNNPPAITLADSLDVYRYDDPHIEPRVIDEEDDEIFYVWSPGDVLTYDITDYYTKDTTITPHEVGTYEFYLSSTDCRDALGDADFSCKSTSQQLIDINVNNRIPTVTSYGISPTNPTVEHDLTCSVSAMDEDNAVANCVTDGSGDVTCDTLDTLKYNFIWYDVTDTTVDPVVIQSSTGYSNDDENILLAENLHSDQDLICKVSVFDGYDYVDNPVTVSIDNRVPIIDIPGELDGYRGNNIELDGSASEDLDDDPLEFLWTQESGRDLTIENSDEPLAQVYIPKGKEYIGDYVFKLAISEDGFTTEITDTTTLTISNHIPTFEQPAEITPTEPTIFDDLTCSVLVTDMDTNCRTTVCTGDEKAACDTYTSDGEDHCNSQTNCIWDTSLSPNVCVEGANGPRKQCYQYEDDEQTACLADGCDWSLELCDETFDNLGYTFRWSEEKDDGTFEEKFVISKSSGGNSEPFTFGDVITTQIASSELAGQDVWKCEVTVTDDINEITDEATVSLDNTAPFAEINLSADSFCIVDEVCYFESNATDLDPETNFEYEWTFGDGTTSDEASPGHTYLTYTTDSIQTVSLTVRDGVGGQINDVQDINVYLKGDITDNSGGNPDNCVGINDFSRLVNKNQWEKSHGSKDYTSWNEGDINRDGVTNLYDFSILINKNQWGVGEC